MHTIVLIALLASLSIPFKVRPFEALAWTVLTSPVWIYLTLMVFPPSIPLYWIVIILNMLGWCLLRRNELEANPVTISGESIAIAALIGFAALLRN